MPTAYWSDFFKIHFYLLKGEELPVCIPCNISVEYIFINCVDLQEYRIFFNSYSLRLLYHECSPNNIVEFLKCTNLFSKM